LSNYIESDSNLVRTVTSAKLI